MGIFCFFKEWKSFLAEWSEFRQIVFNKLISIGENMASLQEELDETLEQVTALKSAAATINLTMDQVLIIVQALKDQIGTTNPALLAKVEEIQNVVGEAQTELTEALSEAGSVSA